MSAGFALHDWALGGVGGEPCVDVAAAHAVLVVWLGAGADVDGGFDAGCVDELAGASGVAVDVVGEVGEPWVGVVAGDGSL